jgi:hypothetical protein
MKVKKYLSLFISGGMVYPFFELLSKIMRNPHIELKAELSLWMVLVGGITFILLGLINETKLKNSRMVFQTLIGGLICLVSELLFGLILNVWLKLDIWHYETLHILHQTSLRSVLLMTLITPFAFWLDDNLRYLYYSEGDKKSLLNVYKNLFTK